MLGYAVALAIYPVVTIVTLLVGSALRLVHFPGASLGAVAAVGKRSWSAPFRSSSAPVVRRLGLNDYLEHVLVGAVWGAWHIPYYLYFLDRQVLREFTVMSAGTFIAVSTVVMIVWAIAFGKLRLLRGSLWPAVLMHTVEDALLIQLFTDRRLTIASGWDWLVSPVHGVVSVACFLLIGIGLQTYRRGRTRGR